MFKNIGIGLLIILFPLLLAAQPATDHQKLQWTALPAVPEMNDLTGPFIGRHQRGFMIAGGMENGIIRREAIYIGPDFDPILTRKGTLAPFLSYGVLVPMEDGILLIGGHDSRTASSSVTKMWWATHGDSLAWMSMPDLPLPNFHLSVELVNNRLYAFAGQNRVDSLSLTDDVWILDLNRPTIVQAWRPYGVYPGLPRIHMVSAVQNDGHEDAHIFIFGGKAKASELGNSASLSNTTAAYRFNTHKSRAKAAWQRIADLPMGVSGGSAVPVGDAHILVFGDRREQNMTMVWAYHTITDTWIEVDAIEGQMGKSTVLKMDNRIIYTGGTILKDKSESNVWQVTITEKTTDPSYITLSLVGLYFIVLLLWTLYYKDKSPHPSRYFTASSRHTPRRVGITIAVTYISATLLISTTTMVFATSWLLLPGLLGIFLIAWLVIRYYLPFIRRLEITSIYTYLEYRYNLLMRLFGDFAFIGFHFIQLSLIIYLPASVFSYIGGWPIGICLMAMGLIATAYTYRGGMHQVVWTDTGQFICIVTGISLMIIWSLWEMTGYDSVWPDILKSGKIEMIHESSQIKDLTLWVVLLGAMTIQLGLFTSNQTITQRYLIANDEKEAGKSIWYSAWIILGMTGLIFILGTCIFGLYLIHPEWLAIGMDNESVLSNLTAHHLPPVLAGCVMISMIAAAMSSYDSSLHSLSTVISTDLIQRFKPQITEIRCVELAGKTVLILGLFSTFTAVMMSQVDIAVIFRIAGGLLGMIFSSLAGIFFLGLFTRRARASGVFVGVFTSVSITMFIVWSGQVHIYLAPFIGLCACILVGYLISLLIPTNPVDLRGLTIHTLNRPNEDV
jgi:SSS family solute:Na+ symporter